MSSVSYKSHRKILMFDGMDFPFGKEKMKIHLRTIDDDMWNVVQFRFMVAIPQAPTDEEKKLIQMDAQAKDEIGFLVVVADSFSDGNAEEDSDDLERLSKDLALIMKRFQRLHRKSRF